MSKNKKLLALGLTVYLLALGWGFVYNDILFLALAMLPMAIYVLVVFLAFAGAVASGLFARR